MLPLALLLVAAAAGPPLPADLVIEHAKIWTGDPANPEAEAVAVWRGRVVAVGSSATVRAWVGPKTAVRDLGGKRLVPGFYDSHVHWLGGGSQLARVELKDAATPEEFAKRLKTFDQSMPRDRWMLGGNWDHDRTFAGKLPTAAMLDAAVPNRPVFIRRYDGHMGVANTAALRLAKITAATANPKGGVIERVAGGEPLGVLKDNAMDLIEAVIPEPGDDEIAEAIRAAMTAAAEVGVTSVQDMEGSSPATRRKLVRILQELERRGELTCRIDVRQPISEHATLAALGIQANFGGDFVRLGGVKGFMDGSLGSSTAKMAEPFVFEPKNTGVYVTEPPTMKALVRAADAAKLSVAIHAIGDRANAELLDIFAEVAAANGPRDRRFRIEHAQHLRPADYGRFKQLGVVASMQPYHVADDGRWAVARIGQARCASSYAYRSLLDSGATLAFGSDWPVAPLDPLPGISAAVARQTLDGKNPDGWFPEQRVTLAEALAAYTAGSAYAAHQDGDRGRVKVGQLADFAVLSADPFAAKSPRELAAQLAATKVALTVVGGKVVFERK